MIYHWCPRSDWEAVAGEYRPADLAVEGFVHCSYRHQVETTASRLVSGRGDLVLLCIDETDLPVVAEDCYESGQDYPHVYGPIPVASVAGAVPFPPEPDGSFRFPADLPV